MAKKQNKIIIYAVVLAGIYFLYKKYSKKNKKATDLSNKNIATDIKQTSEVAKDIVQEVISNTKFVPDLQTDSDIYKKDQNNCL